VSFLLDTNVISELRKSEQRADRGVRSWTQTQQLDTLYLSVITIMELEIGMGRLERRDALQGATLRTWLDERVLRAFEHRILSIDLPVARRSAALHVPDPRPERDALIAATALVHDLVVVTRNEADFSALAVRTFNPWQVSAP
jgi:predicted nucleic acid-binding protein